MIDKVVVSVGYLWVLYVVLIMLIITFGAGAYYLYRQVKTAPRPEEQITQRREEEKRNIVIGETPDEFENLGAVNVNGWGNEGQVPEGVKETPEEDKKSEEVVVQHDKNAKVEEKEEDVKKAIIEYP